MSAAVNGLHGEVGGAFGVVAGAAYAGFQAAQQAAADADAARAVAIYRAELARLSVSVSNLNKELLWTKADLEDAEQENLRLRAELARVKAAGRGV